MKNYSTIKSNKLTLSDEKVVDVGPLWSGKLQNKIAISELINILFEKQLKTKNSLWKMLDIIEEEADSSAFYYNSDELSSIFKKSPPKMKTIFEELKNKGFEVTRTHFSPTGFKTDAGVKEIEKMFK